MKSDQLKKVSIHKKLIPFLEGNYQYNVAWGGRASSKSWGVGDVLLTISWRERDQIILCAKGTLISIDDSVKSLLEKLIVRHGWEDFFYITQKEIINKSTGTKFIFTGLSNSKRVKSTEGCKYVWLEEASVDVTEQDLDVLFPTILRNEGSKIFVTFNPENETDAVYEMFIKNTEPDTCLVNMNYYDNPFIPEKFLEKINHMKETNLLKYNHIYLGGLNINTTGALWTQDMIKYASREAFLDVSETNFRKIIISVDPSVGDKAKQDECGIVVAAERDGHYYILEDASFVATPNAWANKVVALHDKWKANYVVAEGNQGQALINSVIHNISPSIRVMRVNARRGKYLRAEPVAALYEAEKVTHMRAFPDMELEMCTFTEKTKKSPNRLDALVWALSDLNQINQAPKGMTRGNMGQMTLRR